MQDRMVRVITTLAEMLGEYSESLTEANDRADQLRTEAFQHTQEVEDLKLELQSAYRRCTQLEEELSYQRQHGSNSHVYGEAQLFQAFIKDPEKMMAALGYLRGTTTDEMQHNKIALIKEVRSLTHMGLKESKDLVEAFLEFPTSAPGPVSLQDGGPLD